ncbi:MAG TPA: phage holin family protein [Tepidiformaceae bacterium]|nr:phage holin family protein [Tepidiformaceae bacterium]
MSRFFSMPGRHESFGDRVIAFVIRWAILCVAVWVAASVVSGIHWDGWKSIIIVALVLGLLNALLRPLLFWVSLPLTIITLGLFLIVLNAFLLWLTACIAEHSSQVHFEIDHFWWDAILGAIIISVVSWVVGMVVKPPKRLIL